MSIDTPAADTLTPEVRDYLKTGLQQVDDSIKQTEERKAEAEKRLATLNASRTQLLDMLGGYPAEPRPDIPVGPAGQDSEAGRGIGKGPFVCKCGRVAIWRTPAEPVHEVDGQTVAAGEQCAAPHLGSGTNGTIRPDISSAPRA